MDKARRDELIRLIANPPPRSKIAAAKEFGVDLTLVVHMLELTPTERLEKLAEAQAFVQELQTAMEAEGRKQDPKSRELGPRNDFERIFKILCGAEVRFVMMGDLALAAYGRFPAALLPELCYDRGHDNIERLAKALEPFHPRLRGVPDDLPFRLDATALARGLNFTLTTDLGDIDLFGEVTGIGGYREVEALSTALVLFGFKCSVPSFDGLIQSKRAAARPKDLLILPEIEALREMDKRVKAQTRLAGDRNRSRGKGKKS